MGKKIDEISCFHSLELNDIHLALARRNLVEEWTSEEEIRSMNELTNMGYAKDYDAIVTLRDRSARSRFALEYERSPKSLRDYAKIRQAIETEDQVDVFLYLVPNHHLLSFVGECFAGTRRRLYFGLAHELTELGLEALISRHRQATGRCSARSFEFSITLPLLFLSFFRWPGIPLG